MARFHFRLQSLLHYRQHLVGQAEQALAQLIASEQALVTEIEQCRSALACCPTGIASVKARDLQAHDAHRHHLLERIALLEQQRAVIHAERERLQEELIERMQECETIEKLRQRRLEEYLLDQRRREQHQLDEIAARRQRSITAQR